MMASVSIATCGEESRAAHGDIEALSVSHGAFVLVNQVREHSIFEYNTLLRATAF